MRDATATRQETNKKVNDILLPSQQERLRQIILQTQGPQAAATNEELAKALGLTDEQKQKIKDIAAETLQKLIEEKVLSVLTPDQQSKLESLKGKEFKMDRGSRNVRAVASVSVAATRPLRRPRPRACKLPAQVNQPMTVCERSTASGQLQAGNLMLGPGPLGAVEGAWGFCYLGTLNDGKRIEQARAASLAA